MSMKHFNIAVFVVFAVIMIYCYVLSKRANPVFLPQPQASDTARPPTQ